MANKKNKSQIDDLGTIDRVDSVRKELEGKLTILSNKVDEKVSEKLFYWIFGILILILVSVLGWMFIHLGTISDRSIRLETKLEDMHSKK